MKEIPSRPRRTSLLLLALLLAALVLHAGSRVGLAAGDPPRFAIYRAVPAPPDSLPGLSGRKVGPSLVHLSQKDFLRRASPDGPPILTEAEIERYCWSGQVLHLTPEGERRWNALGGGHVPLEGLPLIVEVDGRSRYGALLWNPVSSRASPLPCFWSLAVEGRVHLGGWALTAEGDTLYKANFDPEVRRVMEEAGKLSEDCGRE